uniref:NACHT domain-containing protein n=1 Tax=Lepisosteus oculatus TaxID=7918 RepID=W5MPC8_LEPOC
MFTFLSLSLTLSPCCSAPGVEFVDNHRATLIQRVNPVDPIADELLSEKMIHQESYNRVHAATTPQDKMRELYKVLDSGGTTVKNKFYSILQKNYRPLVEDLASSPECQQAPGSQTHDTGYLQTLKDKHKEALKRKFEVVSEGIAKPGEQTLLDDIFTHMWISEGSCVEVNHEHEVRQVETVSKTKKSEIRSINCSDIFKPLPGQTRPIRTVMMKGVAGIGKTFSVQKFILDWATGKNNQDFDFIFFLPFRELNLIKSEMSLRELVLCFCPEIKSSDNVLDGHKVQFILDGLDESKYPLNFKTNQRWSDVKKQASVDVLLTNLIKRNFPVN